MFLNLVLPRIIGTTDRNDEIHIPCRIPSEHGFPTLYSVLLWQSGQRLRRAPELRSVPVQLEWAAAPISSDDYVFHCMRPATDCTVYVDEVVCDRVAHIRYGWWEFFEFPIQLIYLLFSGVSCCVFTSELPEGIVNLFGLFNQYDFKYNYRTQRIFTVSKRFLYLFFI